MKAAGKQGNPKLRKAQAGVAEAHAAATIARYAYLPSLVFDFCYGIDEKPIAGLGERRLRSDQEHATERCHFVTAKYLLGNKKEEKDESKKK